ncbi:MAG: flagellar protein [Acetobacteraceae bacterium]|nr:flagellar protein [Acetobacteraceae bacterium]
MPLKVVLRPGEKLIVNGAVLGAGDRAATLFLHNHAQFLRGRDMLRPEDARCPLGRLQLAIQGLYLASDQERPAHRASLADAARAARECRPDLAAEIATCAELVLAGAGYQAMRRCARLLLAPSGG